MPPVLDDDDEFPLYAHITYCSVCTLSLFRCRRQEAKKKREYTRKHSALYGPYHAAVARGQVEKTITICISLYKHRKFEKKKKKLAHDLEERVYIVSSLGLRPTALLQPLCNRLKATKSVPRLIRQRRRPFFVPTGWQLVVHITKCISRFLSSNATTAAAAAAAGLFSQKYTQLECSNDSSELHSFVIESCFYYLNKGSSKTCWTCHIFTQFPHKQLLLRIALNLIPWSFELTKCSISM